MKELLISFILVLIVGSAINGYMSSQSPTPEPKATDTQNNNATTSTPDGQNAGGQNTDGQKTGALTTADLSDATFNDVVLQSDSPVLVDFYATWCGPCKYMAPIVDQINSEYTGKAKVYKVNVDNNPVLAQKYDIASFPRFLIFKNGQVVATFVGSQPKETLTNALDQYSSL